MPAPPAPADLRVAQLVPSLWTGGLERVATELSIALQERIERVVVCSSGGAPFEGVVLAAGLTLVHVPRPRPRPLPLLRCALALAPVLRRERPHVVHAHNPGAAFAAALARRLARADGTAILTTYHGVMPGRVGRAARVLAHTSDLVVAVAPAATDALVGAGLPPERAATVANAVSPRPGRPREAVRAELDARDRPLVVTVGRYAEEKNQALLLDAVALLDRPVRVVLAGVGPLEDDLRRRVRELGLEDTALVAGERADAIDLTAAADVFALTSDWEGLPLAILEALALGTPVVATAVGGIPGAVRHEETGLLVPPRDAPALAAALERVLDDAALAGRLAAAGRALAAAEYSEAAMVDRYVELYSELSASRPSRRRRGARPS